MKDKNIKIIIKTERWLNEEEYEAYKNECPLPFDFNKVDRDGYDEITNLRKPGEEVKTDIQKIIIE